MLEHYPDPDPEPARGPLPLRGALGSQGVSTPEQDPGKGQGHGQLGQDTELGQELGQELHHEPAGRRYRDGYPEEQSSGYASDSAGHDQATWEEHPGQLHRYSDVPSHRLPTTLTSCPANGVK